MRGEIHDTDHSERKGYWYGELRSLGIEPKRSNELNDIDELGNLTDNIKQTMYQDYKTAYRHSVANNSHYEYIRQSFEQIS